MAPSPPENEPSRVDCSLPPPLLYVSPVEYDLTPPLSIPFILLWVRVNHDFEHILTH